MESELINQLIKLPDDFNIIELDNPELYKEIESNGPKVIEYEDEIYKISLENVVVMKDIYIKSTPRLIVTRSRKEIHPIYNSKSQIIKLFKYEGQFKFPVHLISKRLDLTNWVFELDGNDFTVEFKDGYVYVIPYDYEDFIEPFRLNPSLEIPTRSVNPILLKRLQRSPLDLGGGYLYRDISKHLIKSRWN